MHEFSLISDLICKISTVAREQRASKIISVTIKIGALSHISPNHLREHFVHAARGTVAEGAQLNIEVMTDTTDPLSQEIMIENIGMAE